jgi:hypothetical protein
MQTEEIPPAQWPTFLKDFSRVHLGHQVRLWVYAPVGGLRREAVDLPLVGIDTDRSTPGGERMDVIVGDSPRAHVAHRVRRPCALRVATRDGGMEMSLQIDSEDGSSTFLDLAQPPGAATPAAFA